MAGLSHRTHASTVISRDVQALETEPEVTTATGECQIAKNSHLTSLQTHLASLRKQIREHTQGQQLCPSSRGAGESGAALQRACCEEGVLIGYSATFQSPGQTHYHTGMPLWLPCLSMDCKAPGTGLAQPLEAVHPAPSKGICPCPCFSSCYQLIKNLGDCSLAESLYLQKQPWRRVFQTKGQGTASLPNPELLPQCLSELCVLIASILPLEMTKRKCLQTQTQYLFLALTFTLRSRGTQRSGAANLSWAPGCPPSHVLVNGVLGTFCGQISVYGGQVGLSQALHA